MTPRLVIFLFVSALVGVGAAVASVASGLGFVVALLAYCGASSFSLLGLAVAAMPRTRTAPRRALLPAPHGHTVA